MKLWMYEGPRRKYVCVDCQHIFKEKYFTETILTNRERQAFQGARCNKCGKDGVAVGQTFRHCKTQKEWQSIKALVESSSDRDVLIKQFMFCEYDREQSRLN